MTGKAVLLVRLENSLKANAAIAHCFARHRGGREEPVSADEDWQELLR